MPAVAALAVVAPAAGAAINPLMEASVTTLPVDAAVGSSFAMMPPARPE